MMAKAPEVSVVLPLHDEELLLPSAVDALVDGLTGGPRFELLLCENGSRDRTREMVDVLAAERDCVRSFHLPVANYGEAIRLGIDRARADHVVILNADLWDLDFIRKAPSLLRDADVVVASKRHPGSKDTRSWARRMVTNAFTRLLNAVFGYVGTDTHGMKAVRRKSACAALAMCVSSNELLDSEMVIRIQRAGGRVVEVPVAVSEKRPSRQPALVRAGYTVRDLGRLAWALGAGRRNPD